MKPSLGLTGVTANPGFGPLRASTTPGTMTVQNAQRPARGGERGFTLVEVLIAILILSIALVSVVGTAVLQGGIAASLPTGQAAVTRGYYVSTATMLAQERLEEVKRLQYTIGPPAVNQIGDPPGPPATLGDEGFGSITGYPAFSRQVRVQNGPSANMRTVTVTVTLNLPGETRMSQESIAVTTHISARP